MYPTAGSQAVAGSSAWRTLNGLRVREVKYRAGTKQPGHRHDYGSFSLVLAGQVEETSSNWTYRASAGSLVVKPADCWHTDSYGPWGAHLVQVIPDATHPHWSDARLVYRWRDTPRLARAMLTLVAGRDRTAEAAELALWDFADELLPRRGPEPAAPPAWWAEAVDLLDDCQRQSISVAAVARRLGVHPVHLARVCRRQFGCSVRQYIRQRRVLAAWRACQRAEDPLAAIAIRTGFADQAHMTRAFAEVLGLSPARLRRLIAG